MWFSFNFDSVVGLAAFRSKDNKIIVIVEAWADTEGVHLKKAI